MSYTESLPYLITEPITSVQQTKDGNAVLVSTLDSTIRLMDKCNGQMLQRYRSHTNTDYRIRSCLGLGDSVVMSGSEDGKLYTWDLLDGKVLETLSAHGDKVASAVSCCSSRKEWASAGTDGNAFCVALRRLRSLIIGRFCRCLGHVSMNVTHRFRW